MNWGKGIIIGMALFMAFILLLVSILMRQNIDLVEEDYYTRELNYDDQFNAQKVYASAIEKISIESKSDSLLIYFPKDFQSEEVKVSFQRPNDKNKDVSFMIVPIEKVIIPTSSFPKGLFNCTIQGSIQDRPYEMSQQITIP
ncbi:FixH family protein [Fluviicola sp.]|uniref:FixH family protein n=1 Tax=Fluviicola sp. TaxID=1917219 RepID=UPI0031DED779